MIRHAGPGDAAAIERIVARAFAPYTARIGRPPAPMAEDYARRIAEGAVWVLDEGGIAGVLVIAAAGDALVIETVAATRPDTGAGRRLLAAAEDRARAAGLFRLTLYTNAAMTENLSLYPRLGYAETARTRQDGFDRVFYEKRLGTPDAP